MTFSNIAPALLAAEGSGIRFLDLFNVNIATIGFTLFNTLVILLLYRFLLHAKVVVVLDKRKAAIEAELTAAEEAKEKANAAEKEYKELLANSKAKANEIVTAAIGKAGEREEEIIAQAESDAAKIRRKAEEDIERERKRAVNEIKNQITELVIMAAERVSEKEINESDNAKLIESFLVSADANSR